MMWHQWLEPHFSQYSSSSHSLLNTNTGHALLQVGQLWQAFRVAAGLLRSVNTNNIFYRSREGFGPDAPGKQVAGLLGACCDAPSVSESARANRSRSNTFSGTIRSVRSRSPLKGPNSQQLDQGSRLMHDRNHASSFATA